MSKPVIIEKDGKPEFAVLAYGDYVRLVAVAEDAEDAAALDAFDAAASPQPPQILHPPCALSSRFKA